MSRTISRIRSAILVLLVLFMTAPAFGQKAKATASPEFTVTAEMLNPLSFRLVGPAAFSGRVIEVAVNPKNFSEYYVATGSGGLWKTTNAGTTFDPIFDDQAVYSIGYVTIDPKNTDVVWVGTGENNSQRAIAVGDGVYKSTDGGKTFQNMGLKKSSHIGKIVIDPRNSDVVYVAAHGQIWGPGGERGLYKTTDGGKTWNRVLFIGEYTAINDVEMDPRNPDILYASAHQRERRVYSKINGGPESGLHKSTDGGKTWKKLTNGFPTEGNIGRIGIVLAKSNPDILYAMVELSPAAGRSSFLRSSDKGETWVEMSKQSSSSPQYYQKLISSPVDENVVVSMDVNNSISKDGGKTWTTIGSRNKHVDNHSLWIDPTNTNHYIAGCDGGLYETWDAGANWKFNPHLPFAQFYHVRADNNYPFYNLYGGTQDNGSWYGPARTIRQSIVNDDFRYANGGDGFLSIPDPKDPTTSYHESQDGGIVRYDHLLERAVSIKPRSTGGVTYRFDWDTPYLISQYDNNTLYLGTQMVMKSTDRGTTWKEISADLSRNLNIDSLPLMGQLWDRQTAVALHSSTSAFGHIKTLAESTLKMGMIYAGTDDGLIWLTEDDGATWTKYDNFPGVPEMTFVSSVYPSLYDVNTVFATFDGKKDNSNWTPYVLKSTDKGKTWKSIASNLPLGTVYDVVQDHINPDLLFVGTEYGVYVTVDGGGKWMQIKNGLPTIQVCDVEIQKRENDLVIATFGRGFYVLDDYSYLRDIKKETFQKPGHIFGIKDTWMFSMSANLTSQGEAYFKTPNPAVAVNIKYFIKEEPPVTASKKAQVSDAKPEIIISIMNAAGEVVSTTTRPFVSGVNSFAWNMRFTPPAPAEGQAQARPQGQGGQRMGGGRAATAGKYFVKIEKKLGDKVETIAEPVEFTIKNLDRELMRNPGNPVVRYM